MKAPLNGVVAITGASSGIGEALARQLDGTATRLVLIARRKERLEALAASLSVPCTVLPCDLLDRDARRELVDALNALPVDVLVNNAGLGDIALFEHSDGDKIERMLELNILALTHLTRGVVDGMIARKRGGILNISSGFGLTTMPAVAAYAGSKHYVTAFTESLRMELGDHGIVVTQVCPGPVDTEFESNAGNPTGMSVPSLVEIDADHCARTALRGFGRGRAMVIPGVVAGTAIRLGQLTPRPLLRLVYSPLARLLRRRVNGA